MLTGKQKRYLRSQAHHLRPVVRVGRQGVTTQVLEAADKALADHELIKVRMYEPDDKKTMAARLAQGTGSELVGLVGHTVILYRPDPEEPAIVLPS